MRLATILLALLLAGCVTTPPALDNPQSAQGLDRLHVERCPGSEDWCVVDVSIGRDKQAVVLSVHRAADGSWSLHYQAGYATGLEHARVRAAVEAEIARTQSEAGREALQGLLRMMGGGLGL